MTDARSKEQRTEACGAEFTHTHQCTLPMGHDGHHSGGGDFWHPSATDARPSNLESDLLSWVRSHAWCDLGDAFRAGWNAALSRESTKAVIR